MSADPAHIPAPAVALPAPTASLPRLRPVRPWVLMYHSVTEHTEDPYNITVSPGRLDRQLRWLRRRGLRGVGVGELLRERAAGRGAGLVGLTFDDGYADFASRWNPILDVFDEVGVRFAHEVHPSELAYDY